MIYRGQLAVSRPDCSLRIKAQLLKSTKEIHERLEKNNNAREQESSAQKLKSTKEIREHLKKIIKTVSNQGVCTDGLKPTKEVCEGD